MYGFITCLITFLALLVILYTWCCKPPKSLDHKTIMESKLFKISLLAPIVFSLLSAAFIFIVIDGKFDFGISGIDSFKNFYEIFKIPLSLIAASPVTAGIAAIIHRSEETAKQIELSSRQIELSSKQYQKTLEKNNFENYIKHRDDFCKRITNIAINDTNIDSLFMSESIYKFFFPSNNYENIKIAAEQEKINLLKLYFNRYLTHPLTKESYDQFLLKTIEILGIIRPNFKNEIFSTDFTPESSRIIFYLNFGCTIKHEHDPYSCTSEDAMKRSIYDSMVSLYNLISVLLNMLDSDFSGKPFLMDNFLHLANYICSQEIKFYLTEK